MHTTSAADDFEFFICPKCDGVFSEIAPHTGAKFDEDDADDDSLESNGSDDTFSELQPSVRSKGKRKGKNGPGTDEMGFEPKSASSTWLNMSDRDPNAKLVPSTKVTVLKSLLLKGFEEAPMDKVLPPSSF
jgi:hypothetical protein